MQLFEVLATICAGIGIFLSGVKTVSRGMRNMTGRKIKALITRLAGNEFLASIWGFLSGAISQNAANTTFVVSSLVSSEAITIRSALPLIAWSNIGTSVLVFLISFDINVAILFLLGTSGIVYGLYTEGRFKHLLESIFGIALLLFGFQLMKSGTKPLAGFEFVNYLFDLASHSLFFSFLIGTILRSVIQSSSTVTILMITTALTGLLNIDQLLMGICGNYTGSSIAILLLSAKIKGVPKQVVLFKILNDIFASLFFASLLVIENFTEIPMFKAFILLLADDMKNQAAFAYVAVMLLPTILAMIFKTSITKLLVKLSPPTAMEDMSKPKYIKRHSYLDPETATDLIVKEHERVISRLNYYLDSVSMGRTDIKYSISTINNANRVLFKEMHEYMRSLVNMNISQETSEKIINIQNRQLFIETIDKTIFMFSTFDIPEDISQELKDFYSKMVLALRTIIMSFHDVASTDDDTDAEILNIITINSPEMMENIRKNYMDSTKHMSAHDKPMFIQMTDYFQRILWLINEWNLLHMTCKEHKY